MDYILTIPLINLISISREIFYLDYSKIMAFSLATIRNLDNMLAPKRHEPRLAKFPYRTLNAVCKQDNAI